MPEALAALWSVLSAFLMLQRVEVLQKEVPHELSRCGKKKPACVPVYTHAGFDRICLSMRNYYGRPTVFVGHRK